ncbi:MAG TPA: phage DNA encapsidation protein [Nitrospira sp.]|nr:phage DNA encapsidation protein [Nitrospira sp.]
MNIGTHAPARRPPAKKRRQTRVHPYYSYNKILSVNAMFNFIVGGRGLGKTYGAQKLAIKKALRTGDQFMYVRRYKEELKAAKDTFFAAIQNEFPEWEFRVNGPRAEATEYIEQEPDETAAQFAKRKQQRYWQTIGFFQALSVAQQMKSTAYPDVTLIIFDEFIIETGTNVSYLRDEVNAFLNLFNTVDRTEDKTRALFLANSVSIMNPYFIYWEIWPDKLAEFSTMKNGDIALHFPTSKAFATSVYETRFGKFIAGTDYANYAVGNEFRDNGEALIAQKTKDARYNYTLETKGGVFSVWRDPFRTMTYILDRRVGNEQFYTMLASRMAEGKQVVTFNEPVLAILRRDFNRGLVMFDKPSTRNAFVPIFERR